MRRDPGSPRCRSCPPARAASTATRRSSDAMLPRNVSYVSCTSWGGRAVSVGTSARRCGQPASGLAKAPSERNRPAPAHGEHPRAQGQAVVLLLLPDRGAGQLEEQFLRTASVHTIRGKWGCAARDPMRDDIDGDLVLGAVAGRRGTRRSSRSYTDSVEALQPTSWSVVAWALDKNRPPPRLPHFWRRAHSSGRS